MNSLRIHEVAARDGLQNESALLSTEQKLELLRRLAAARPDSLEVTSFVRPDAVPQLADADALCAQLAEVPWRSGLTLVGLVMNLRGWERFRAAGLDGLTAVIGAHEGFSKANSGMDIAQAVEVNEALLAAARAEAVPVRMYLSMAFGAPGEDAPPIGFVADLVQRFYEAGAALILPSDTVGVATPSQTVELIQSCLERVPAAALGLHMHDTYGRALENCAAVLDLGLRSFDASAGGTGGCPFAPGAAGNLATGALLGLARERGLAPEMDADALDEASRYLASILDRPLAEGDSRGPRN